MTEINIHSRNKNLTNFQTNHKSADLKHFFTKIKKSPVFNAFQRKSLGSIPSKFDNFIFNIKKDPKNRERLKLNKKFKSENDLFINDIFENEHRPWGNYGTGNSIEIKGNILKFSVNNDLKNLSKKSEFNNKNIDSFNSVYSYDINTNKSTNLTNNIDNNNNNFSKNDNKRKIIYKNNSEPKMNFSKEDRYYNIYYKNKILNQYLPGPGDYDLQNNNENRNNFRYYSLFKGKSTFPIFEIKSPTADIGPGSYDILKDENIPGGIFSKLKKYDNFNSPFNISDKDIQTSPGSNNQTSSFNIKNICKKNYFFMIKSPRKEKLEIKLGLNRNDKEIISHKINEYRKKENNNWEKGRSINTNWINSKLEKKIKEKIKEGNILEKINEKNNEFELNINDNNNNTNTKEIKIPKKLRKVFSFNKIPRFYDPISKHVPGPSYYDPEKILNGIKLKKSFNVKEDGWI